MHHPNSCTEQILKFLSRLVIGSLEYCCHRIQYWSRCHVSVFHVLSNWRIKNSFKNQIIVCPQLSKYLQCVWTPHFQFMILYTKLLNVSHISKWKMPRCQVYFHMWFPSRYSFSNSLSALLTHTIASFGSKSYQVQRKKHFRSTF